jgi:hypothetical protein
VLLSFVRVLTIATAIGAVPVGQRAKAPQPAQLTIALPAGDPFTECRPPPGRGVAGGHAKSLLFSSRPLGRLC